jgi:argininosuccinate lyase
MAGMVGEMTVDRDRLLAAASAGFATATDLADWLVRALGVPFRRAHHITGSLVREAEKRGCDLADLPLSYMQTVEPDITEAVFEVLRVPYSVDSRNSYGGTAPENVKAAVSAARERYL